ncbi:MAG: hypothetical protein JNM56_02200 [Planctomycetia bacterium]|nr:hypothetical protein [Planctomycetia bacterium]
MLLWLSTAAPAQEPQVPFGQGSHALRAILKQKFNIKPLDDATFNQRISNGDVSQVLLVVLGDTGFLKRFGRTSLAAFVQQGGALLVATDRKTGRDALESSFRLRVSGDYLKIDRRSAAAYRRSDDCILISSFDRTDPLFFQVDRIATNRPSHLTLGITSPLRPVAWFPAGTFGEKTPDDLAADRQYPFAASGQLRHGRVLVLGDHSVFINDMILQPDNDNFFFACNAIHWLTEDGKRAEVLFVEDGGIVTNFNVALKEPPPLPMPTEGQLIEAGNQLIAKVDEQDFPNRFINDRMRPVQLWRLVLLLLTGALLLYGIWRLLAARHRVERAEPLLAITLEQVAPVGNLTERRNRELIRRNNYWETAHRLARQLFPQLTAGPPPAAPHIVVRGDEGERRRLEQQTQRLWQLATSRVPEPVSAQELRRLQDELRVVRVALADGTIRLTTAPVAANGR